MKKKNFKAVVPYLMKHVDEVTMSKIMELVIVANE